MALIKENSMNLPMCFDLIRLYSNDLSDETSMRSTEWISSHARLADAAEWILGSNLEADSRVRMAMMRIMPIVSKVMDVACDVLFENGLLDRFHAINPDPTAYSSRLALFLGIYSMNAFGAGQLKRKESIKAFVTHCINDLGAVTNSFDVYSKMKGLMSDEQPLPLSVVDVNHFQELTLQLLKNICDTHFIAPVSGTWSGYDVITTHASIFLTMTGRSEDVLRLIFDNEDALEIIFSNELSPASSPTPYLVQKISETALNVDFMRSLKNISPIVFECAMDKPQVLNQIETSFFYNEDPEHPLYPKFKLSLVPDHVVFDYKFYLRLIKHGVCACNMSFDQYVEVNDKLSRIGFNGDIKSMLGSDPLIHQMVEQYRNYVRSLDEDDLSAFAPGNINRPIMLEHIFFKEEDRFDASEKRKLNHLFIALRTAPGELHWSVDGCDSQFGNPEFIKAVYDRLDHEEISIFERNAIMTAIKKFILKSQYRDALEDMPIHIHEDLLLRADASVLNAMSTIDWSFNVNKRRTLEEVLGL